LRSFPAGKYGRQILRFYPAPFKSPLRAFAVLAFPWRDKEVLLCDIAGRGWCVPSGRVEPEESSYEAVVRETLEEAGASLGDIQYIGCYQITEKSEVRWADCFTGHVASLGEITACAESKGRRFVQRAELPGLYHLWNELTEKVFEHSLEVLRRSEAR
jgi:8-oxo-dGTP diphosphatase